MKRSAVVSSVSAVLTLVLLSGCEIFAYKNRICTADNASDVRAFQGRYTESLSVIEGSEETPMGTPIKVRAQLGQNPGELDLVSDSGTMTYAVCSYGGKMIFESLTNRPETGAPADGFLPYVATQKGSTLTLDTAEYDVDQAQALMPVTTETRPADHDIKFDITTHTADNSRVSPAKMAGLLHAFKDLGFRFVLKRQ